MRHEWRAWKRRSVGRRLRWRVRSRSSNGPGQQKTEACGLGSPRRALASCCGRSAHSRLPPRQHRRGSKGVPVIERERRKPRLHRGSRFPLCDWSGCDSVHDSYGSGGTVVCQVARVLHLTLGQRRKELRRPNPSSSPAPCRSGVATSRNVEVLGPPAGAANGRGPLDYQGVDWRRQVARGRSSRQGRRSDE